jgi:hypothetical protein
MPSGLWLAQTVSPQILSRDAHGLGARAQLFPNANPDHRFDAAAFVAKQARRGIREAAPSVP